MRSAPACLDATDGVGQVRQVGVEDARRDPGPTVGHGQSPTPAGTGSWLRSPQERRGALGDEPSAAPRDGGRRRLAGSFRGELAAGGSDLLAAVAADRRLDARRTERRREALDDGHRAGDPRRVGDRVHRDQVDVGVIATQQLGHRGRVELGVVDARRSS